MWHSSPGPQTRHASCTMEQQYPSRRVVSPLSPLEDPSIITPSLSPITPISPISSHPTSVYNHRCIPQSPPHARRPLLNFPPPPTYPPPHPHYDRNHHHVGLLREDGCSGRGNAGVEEFTVIQVHCSGREDIPLNPYPIQPIREDLNLPGPSHQRNPQPSTSWNTDEILPNDYSYAYYEPGPPTKHTNVPHRHPITNSCRDRLSRHTYLTRYGTEENIYEEISDVARARMMLRPSQQQSLVSLNQSIIEEEVRRVQHRHRKVLGELNLSVEAMLMPTSSQDEDTDKEMDDQLADLHTVGPTDELLSPAPPIDLDSGFSGSSSGTSYVGSMRRGPDRYKNKMNSLKISNDSSNNSKSDSGNSSNTNTKSNEQTGTGASSKSFWSRKGWKKIPVIGGLGSGRSSSNGTPIHCTVF